MIQIKSVRIILQTDLESVTKNDELFESQCKVKRFNHTDTGSFRTSSTKEFESLRGAGVLSGLRNVQVGTQDQVEEEKGFLFDSQENPMFQSSSSRDILKSGDK